MSLDLSITGGIKRGTSRVQTENLVELPEQAQLGVGKSIADTKGQRSLAESEPGYLSASCSPEQTGWAEWPEKGGGTLGCVDL